MKFGRISAMGGALVMTVGALVGVFGSGAASAATSNATGLCVDDASAGGSICTYSAGSGNPVETGYESNTETKWTYAVNIGAQQGTTGYIKDTSSGLCMQLNASGGDTVREATCNGDDAEEWENYPSGSRTAFVSQWSILDSGSGQQLCLSWDQQQNQYGILKADPCSAVADGTVYWYQKWGTS